MEEQSFSVSDRRISHSDQEPTPQPAAEAVAEPATPAADTTAATGSEGHAATDTPDFSAAEGAPATADGVDFTTFAFSLAQWAFIFMGLEPYPDGTEQALNLDGARQNIDILAMLEEKTRGNLSEDESALVTQLLYTLRMSFVEVSKTHPSG